MIKINCNGKWFEVMETDYSDTLCSVEQRFRLSRSEGWRLPTMKELGCIRENLFLKGITNFKQDWYWSSEEFSVSWDLSVPMGLNMEDNRTNAQFMGNGSLSHSLNFAYIRLIRDVEDSERNE